MVYLTKKGDDFIVTCSCGCEEGMAFHLREYEDGAFVYVNLIQSH